MSSYVMRAPCRFCGATEGDLRPTNGQNCVFCLGCGRLAYNAPKTETGEAPRSVSSRPDIPPSQRARILLRDGGRCVLCQRADQVLHVGHVLSVADARRQADEEHWPEHLLRELLSADQNLATLCEECNLGLGAESFDPIFWLRLLRARVRTGKS